MEILEVQEEMEIQKIFILDVQKIFQFFNILSLFVKVEKVVIFIIITFLSLYIDTIAKLVAKNNMKGKNGNIYLTIDFMNNLFPNFNNRYFDRNNLIDKIEDQ